MTSSNQPQLTPDPDAIDLDTFDFERRRVHAASFPQGELDDCALPFGVPSDYVPAIRVRGSRTFGRPTRISSRKAGRVIQTLSTAETLGVLLAEFDPTVLGFFEQFPLPYDEYHTVSSDLGRRAPGGDFVDRLSVDLLLRLAREAWVAVEIKRSRHDFEDPRVVHNFRCKQILLRAVGIQLVTFARDDLDPVIGLNLANLFAASAVRIDRDILIRWAAQFCSRATVDRDASIDDLALFADTAVAGPVLFKKAVWHHLIPVDLRQPLRFDRPPVLSSNDMGVHFPW